MINRSRLQSGFVVAEIIISTSKVRKYVQQRRLRLKETPFQVLGERLLPVGDRGADCASFIAGQTQVCPHSRSFMADRFGESRACLGRALQLKDCRLILAFGTEIYSTTDSAFGRAFGETCLPLQLSDQVIDFDPVRVNNGPTSWPCGS